MNELNALLCIVQLSDTKKKRGQYLTFQDIEDLLNDQIVFTRMPKGHYITAKNTPAETVYYILSGAFVNMKKMEPITNNIFTAEKVPQFLGIESAFFPDNNIFPDILILEDCDMLEINSSYFFESIQKNSSFAFELVKLLCKKLADESQRIENLLFLTSEDKLMIYIVKYWSKYHTTSKECLFDVKNDCIADYIGTSIRTVYRIIDKLKQKELLAVVKGNITVTDEQVNKMAHLLDTKTHMSFSERRTCEKMS